jgi:hypothetical protein
MHLAMAWPSSLARSSAGRRPIQRAFPRAGGDGMLQHFAGFPECSERAMAVSYAQDIVRHFRENGLKLLLQHPAHARDLLTLGGYDQVAAIDFGHLRVDPTTYVAANCRHVSADLVLTAPFRGRQGQRRRTVTLYILIEHQSEPDAVMLLRVLDYLVQIYKGQLRA